MELLSAKKMKIRYQNGSAVEAIALSKSGQSLRVAVKDAEDAMELTHIRGTWVTDDCEPVTLEMGLAGKPVENFSDDSFLCSQQLAEYLVRLLHTDDRETFVQERDAWMAWQNEKAPLIA